MSIPLIRLSVCVRVANEKCVEVYTPTNLRADALVRLGEGGPVVLFRFFFLRGLRGGVVMFADSAIRVSDSGLVADSGVACCVPACQRCIDRTVLFTPRDGGGVTAFALLAREGLGQTGTQGGHKGSITCSL